MEWDPPPAHIEAIFRRPGITWVPRERRQVTAYVGQHCARLEDIAERVVGYDDAPDVVQDFFVCPRGLSYVMDHYDPLRGTFPRLCERRFYHHCIDEWRKKHQREAHEGPLPERQDMETDEPIELELVDEDLTSRPEEAYLANEEQEEQQKELARQRAQAERVQRCLNQLRPTYREVIILVDMKGVPQKEAACILGISYDILRHRLMRARKKFRACLQNDVSRHGKEGSDHGNA